MQSNDLSNQLCMTNLLFTQAICQRIIMKGKPYLNSVARIYVFIYTVRGISCCPVNAGVSYEDEG